MLGQSFNKGSYSSLSGQSRCSTVLLGLGVSAKALSTIAFALVYLLAILYLYTHNYRDPTSLFWDPEHGYDRAYSRYRESEALAFITTNNDDTSLPRSQRFNPTTSNPNASNSSTVPSLCLGIATIARPSVQYIQQTVGSVLAGLTAEQRDTLYFIFFIAHSDPSVHPIHGQPWTINLPDRLLDYDRTDNATLEQIRGWEHTGNHREKAFYDYIHLLNACRDSGAPYIAMLEGDVLAAPGWLPRSIEAAQIADEQAGWTTGENDTAPEEAAGGAEVQVSRPAWLYIRMFWTETYLGWNSEEWPTYLFYCGSAWALLVTTLLTMRFVWAPTRPLLTNASVATVSFVWLPLCILLYFAAGRMSVRPPPAGVRPMENYGCCSQGMIFRAEQAPTIIDAIEKRLEGYMDMLLEMLATKEGLQKWAIFPSVLQHIGGESSKGDPVADARARMIWNFAFERYGDALAAGRKLWK